MVELTGGHRTSRWPGGAEAAEEWQLDRLDLDRYLTFVRHPMVVARDADGTQHVLHGRDLARRPVDGPATHVEVADADGLGDALADRFGLRLAHDDLVALAERRPQQNQEAS